MRVGSTYKQKDVTSENMSLKTKVAVDDQLKEVLQDPHEGIFRPGSLPKVPGISSAGSKELLGSLEKARG